MGSRRLPSALLALLLALSLLTACGGGGASAAGMRLRKTEGTVAVQDDGGADVTPKENLNLYSGYGVATQAASYAWIDLDAAKLTKLDESSEVAVTQDGKALTLDVLTGNLYFNITEPLAEDETLDIRTSTMVTGIRGTRGWVTQESVCLLEGTVTVTAGEQTVTVTAGQMARFTPDGTLEAAPLYQEDVPAFVAPELPGDEPPLPPAPTPGGDPSLLTGIGYIGDPAASTMTPEQAAELADRLSQLITQAQGVDMMGTPLSINAVLFDAGDGSPALAFGTTAWGMPLDLYYYKDGVLTRYAEVPDSLMSIGLHDGVLCTGGYLNADGSRDAAQDEGRWTDYNWVFDLNNGGLYAGPVTSSSLLEMYGQGEDEFRVDGVLTTRDAFSTWGSQWMNNDYVFGMGNGGGGFAIGAPEASDVLAALRAWGAGTP